MSFCNITLTTPCIGQTVTSSKAVKTPSDNTSVSQKEKSNCPLPVEVTLKPLSQSPVRKSSEYDVGPRWKHRGETRVQFGHEAFKVPGGLSPKHIEQLSVHQSKPALG